MGECRHEKFTDDHCAECGDHWITVILTADDRIAELKQERDLFRQLVVDQLEEETEFDTEWDKAARAALEGK